jgi:hypothetical protein
MKTIVIVAVVLILALAARKVWVLSAGRKRREHQELVRRRKEDAERQEFFSHGQAMKRAEEYRRMQKLREEAGAPVLDLPEEEDTKTWPGPQAPAV